MAIEQQNLAGLEQVAVNELQPGMYVAQLDRKWEDSAFLVQGFYVRSQADIDRVAEECQSVFVDPRRYQRIGAYPQRSARKPSDKATKVVKYSARERLVPRQPIVYEDQVETREEMPRAVDALEVALPTLGSCVDKIRRVGHFEVGALEEAVTPLVQSVIRNRTAMGALVRMRDMGGYIYTHAISCSVWSAILARELGLPEADINRLALACAVMDLGKLRLPSAPWQSDAALPEESVDAMRLHVEASLDGLKKGGLQDPVVLAAIETHHERFDGSGYPHGLSGSKIPVAGRVAGIVDSYDAMISVRPYAPIKSSYEAIQELYQQADKLFQQELVEYFVKAIGVFPVGSVVELNTGEVGIVVAQSMQARLKPKVMLILDEQKQPRKKMMIIDLAAQEPLNSQVLDWWITKELPKHAYGIDPQTYFLD